MGCVDRLRPDERHDRPARRREEGPREALLPASSFSRSTGSGCSSSGIVRRGLSSSARLSGTVRDELGACPLGRDLRSTPSAPADRRRLCVGGIFMGFGSRWAGGCTSGHGISGTLQLTVVIVARGRLLLYRGHRGRLASCSGSSAARGRRAMLTRHSYGKKACSWFSVSRPGSLFGFFLREGRRHPLRRHRRASSCSRTSRCSRSCSRPWRRACWASTRCNP
ncbi:MAG: YeeE/YedE family protein [Desulfobacterales bacterium]|nr:YeeE/YedE family protein [Desulfobacterales bacterium]